MCSSIKFLDRYCRRFHGTDLKSAPVVAAQQRQPLCLSAERGLGHTYPPAYHCCQGKLSCGLHLNHIQVPEEEISSMA